MSEDATPTRIDWRVDDRKYLVGYEMPAESAHIERLVGSKILDKGELRDLLCLVLVLPTDPAEALAWKLRAPGEGEAA